MMEKKLDYKKDFKELYVPKKIEIIDIPKMSFFMIDGQGNPNGEEFAQVVGALYSLAYAIKMSPKKGVEPAGYIEYTVFPLEGVWDLTDLGKTMLELDKNQLVYSVMIRQPDFVTPDYAKQIIEQVKKSKPNPKLEGVRFEEVTEGLCAQMMHIGPYDDEPASFAKMETFCHHNGYQRLEKIHREIYLSDPRKVDPQKMRTVLRVKVQKER
jgi:hypothetical protein